MNLSPPHPSTDSAHAELRLPPNVNAPALARHAVHDLLGTLPAPLLARLSLVASELVTNVLRHCSTAEPGAILTLTLASDRVILAVTDGGAGFEPSEIPPADGTGGWGLRVVDAISDRWWVEREGGTRVICEIDR